MQIHPPFKILAVVVGSLALAACGSSSKKTSTTTASPASPPTALSLSISESGKKPSFTAPASTKGGVVNVTLQNQSKKPAEAQLARLDPGHGLPDVLKALGGGGPPPWAHLEGGVSSVLPGQKGTATLSLPAGNYVVIDTSMGPGGGGPPAVKALKVTSGGAGSLPSTAATVTAAAPAKDKYNWQISGALKPGDNRLTFVSKGGPDALHLIAAVRLNGKASDAQIAKALKSQGKPPPFLDQSTFASTTILDGGKSEVASLSLRKPGEYVLFCPLKDRDGGKSHDQEGLITRVNVK
jgi:hypothetical protein